MELGPRCARRAAPAATSAPSRTCARGSGPVALPTTARRGAVSPARHRPAGPRRADGGAAREPRPGPPLGPAGGRGGRPAARAVPRLPGRGRPRGAARPGPLPPPRPPGQPTAKRRQAAMPAEDSRAPEPAAACGSARPVPVARAGPWAAARSRASGPLVVAGGAGARRARAYAQSEGAGESGLSRVVELHFVNPADDAALTVSLAGTIFAIPTDEARGQVAQFLLLTMAPFALLAPFVGPLLDRFRHGRRWAIGTTLALRAFLCWVLADAVARDSAWLFPAALGCLGLQGVCRDPRVRRAAPAPARVQLVSANSRSALAGVAGMAVGGSLAVGAARIGPSGRCASPSRSTSSGRCSPSGSRPGSTPPSASAASRTPSRSPCGAVRPLVARWPACGPRSRPCPPQSWPPSAAPWAPGCSSAS